VKTAIMSVAGPGEKLLISRNAHKSVMAGVIVSGIVPVWVHPHFDEELALAHPPEPEDVRRALAANPDAKGMLLITPTDWGTRADIAGVAEVCHAADVPLIVDEAVGRVAAEMVSPYPPGVPVLAPGERIDQEAVDYVTTGVAAGMLIPDAADPELKTLRVVAG
jgi:arginine/lysine/ornithine decarboxylase